MNSKEPECVKFSASVLEAEVQEEQTLKEKQKEIEHKHKEEERRRKDAQKQREQQEKEDKLRSERLLAEKRVKEDTELTNILNVKIRQYLMFFPELIAQDPNLKSLPSGTLSLVQAKQVYQRILDIRQQKQGEELIKLFFKIYFQGIQILEAHFWRTDNLRNLSTHYDEGRFDPLLLPLMKEIMIECPWILRFGNVGTKFIGATFMCMSMSARMTRADFSKKTDTKETPTISSSTETKHE